MPQLIDARLILIGSENAVRRFEHSTWARRIRARQVELYEFSDGRRVWWFQTVQLSTRRLATFSCEFHGITLMLDYEDHVRRIKALVKAVAGRVDHCTFSY
jgi:hypothetical protein